MSGINQAYDKSGQVNDHWHRCSWHQVVCLPVLLPAPPEQSVHPCSYQFSHGRHEFANQGKGEILRHKSTKFLKTFCIGFQPPNQSARLHRYINVFKNQAYIRRNEKYDVHREMYCVWCEYSRFHTKCVLYIIYIHEEQQRARPSIYQDC